MAFTGTSEEIAFKAILVCVLGSTTGGWHDRKHAGVSLTGIATALALFFTTFSPLAQSVRDAELSAIYATKQTDCYVLLKNQPQEVQSGDYPICLAVLRNLNHFCAGPPQYDRRKTHPSNSELREPAWVPMDPAQNLELVQNTYLAHVLPQYRAALWADEKTRIEALAKSGHLHLKRAHLSNGDLRGGAMSVFMLEREPIHEQLGTNQPYLMFARPEETTAATIFPPLALPAAADLWEFRGGYFLVRFDSVQRRFQVRELIRPRPGIDAPVAAPVRCTLQHNNDRQGVK